MAKVESLVSKLKDALSKLVQKNGELVDLEGKSGNKDSTYPVLEQPLDDVTKRNEEMLHATSNYIDTVLDRDTLIGFLYLQCPSKRISGLTTSTKCIWRKDEFLKN